MWMFDTIYCCLIACVFATKEADKAVVVKLSSQWPDTNVLLEATEFMAEESNAAFWQFTDRFADPDVSRQLEGASEREAYDLLIKIAAEILSPARLDLMKFSLALRVQSPQIEMFRQLALNALAEAGSDIQGCDSFAVIQGQFSCDPNQLDTLIGQAGAPDESNSMEMLYSVDHVYPGTRHVLVKVILYSKIGSGSFVKFHTALRRKSLLSPPGVTYVLRHYERNEIVKDRRVRLSGYGVELAIKSQEYKAQDDSKLKANMSGDAVVEEEDEEETDLNGFNFKLLRQLHPELKENLREFKVHLLDADELTPLKIWQLQDLSFQAGQRIVATQPPLDALQVLKEVSQNFPVAARSLTKTVVKRDFREEVESNQEQSLEELGLHPGDSALFINGLLVDLETVDIFSLLDMLKKEERLASGFFHMGYRREYLTMLTSVDLSGDTTSYAIDYRPGHPDFINNLEIDRQYRDWGNSVKMMVQPYFPGMIRPIARNFFTLVFIVNPGIPESQNLLKIAYSFYAHEIPIRIGLIWAVEQDKKLTGYDDTGVAILNLYNFVKSDKGSPKALRYLTDLFDAAFEEKKNVTSEDVVDYFGRKFPGEEAELVFGADSDYDTGRQAGANFLETTGLGSPPKVLLNGVPLDDTGLSADRFEETVINEVMRLTRKIQQEIMQGRLDDSQNVGDYIMNMPDVIPRLNSRILNMGAAAQSGAKPSKFLDMTDTMEYQPKTVYDFRKLQDRQKTAYMAKNLPYLKKVEDLSMRAVTIWIVTDVETAEGRQLVYNAIKHLKSTNKVRVGLIHNPSQNDVSASKTTITKSVQVALKTQQMHIKKNFITKLLKHENYAKLKEDQSKLDDYEVHGMSMQAFRKSWSATSDDFLRIHAIFAQHVLELQPGQSALVANGRLIGPLNPGEAFLAEDFDLLEKFTLSSHAEAVATQIEAWNIELLEDKASDVVMRTSALIMADPVQKRRHWIVLQGDSHSVVNLPASDETTATLDILAVVDPLSRETQRLAPLLAVLVNVINADIKIVMNCKPKLSEMPLKSFYRFVLEPELTFSPEGARRSGPQARFSALPNRQLLTMNVYPPDSWLVAAKSAVYDLDNIKLDQVETEIVANFDLEYLLLEGHCFDEVTGSPPRGLQFTLGTKSNPILVDTIVMANLGYFQLKAYPGAWILQLREGRSRDIYDITTHDNTETPSKQPLVTVILNKFTGKTIRIRVIKKPDRLNDHLLLDAKDMEEKSIWKSISDKFIPGSSKEEFEGTINIFSVASGHLYERFLRIMMLSVMKHTKSNVKFWFLKNYLSPDFKNFLPYLAKHYGFEYELVEYKWPHWLHHQNEKQRIIWGYKILFLDVLFPLDVKKIIYVDADQVVRTDLRELMELPLDGAPYGYTPFCDSRTEMDGFRFWKHGYWMNHLAGRRYHISALYVVDLKKFRQIAAGDRLRGQYQGLSADPNSLSNLDQDLPNNMIHQVKIKSLPQDWLWCETWCDESSKQRAKTIDLCNNPQTKEPKLESAVRIIEEWRDYDNEVKQVRANFESGVEITESKRSPAATHPSAAEPKPPSSSPDGHDGGEL